MNARPTTARPPTPRAPTTRASDALARVLPRAVVQRMSRCFLVSIGTTLLSAVVLVGLALGAGVAAGTANVVAVCCGIGPSYYANRNWVWGRRGRSDLAREVAPFWILSLAGMVVSTVAVACTATLTAHWSTSARAVALPFANLSSFAVLWLVQFVVLDRVLFKAVPAPAAAPVSVSTSVVASPRTAPKESIAS
jgi:putative flippase GtrA